MKKNQKIIIGWSLILLMGLGTSCSRYESTEETQREAPKRQTSTASGIETVSPYISVGNLNTGKLEVYKYSWPDWNVAGAKEWSFAPTTALGFSATGSTYFNGPTDAKVRYNAAFSGATSVVAVTDNSWAGLVTWEGSTVRGTKLWGKYWTGTSPGIHSGEVLPNGNMALAAADENWVRVYNTSVSSGSNYAQFDIVFAHSVLWDTAYNRLWVNGKIGSEHVVTALIVGGTRTAPTLTEDSTYRSKLPGSWAHDLSPYYGDVDKLWASDNQGVYIFNKVTKQFAPAPGASNRIYVKGISNQTEGGVIVETKGENTYSTTVDFFNPTTGVAAGSRTLTNAVFYKGKVFTRAYQ
ncbi:hypothetical protein HDC92_001537 [Pedobacter sp. AK017]|uniref:DUF6528 family protein n=1 Tax=Pedobacter sp. AK017 TaxID=2723073 RepID=UPI001608FAA6|nr:DUF6528 family protein [Pedobacter sp. AK017]MBB5437863.1 hypothetical protein [Pedobacter sp. AK017]